MPDSQASIFEQNYTLTNESISIEYRTTGRLLPSHWHDDMEIIYLLNGSATVFLEGRPHTLVTGDFIVIDAGMIHESQCTRSYMQIVIRIREGLVQSLMGGSRDFRILCSRSDLTRDTLPRYLEICSLLRQLAPLYIQQPRGYMIKSNALVLDVLYLLTSFFSVSFPPAETAAALTLRQQEAVDSARRTFSHPAQLRAREIVRYIDSHYAEPLSLDEIAAHFGLNSEYFSRMFRRTFGIPFTHHLHHVRLVHIYHDICTTDEPVMAVAEKHGFTNYKLFGRLFREFYGKTPREVRREMKERQ